MKSEKNDPLLDSLNSLSLEVTGKSIDVSSEIAVKRLNLALSTLNEVSYATQVQVIMGLLETEQKTLITPEVDRRKRERLIGEWLTNLNQINNQLREDIKKAYRDIWEWE